MEKKPINFVIRNAQGAVKELNAIVEKGGAEFDFGINPEYVITVTKNSDGTTKEETCIFEDALFALKTAKADGFTTVGVYDRHENRQNELQSLADYYIRDFADSILKTI